MRNIPPEMYERVYDLALSIVNATESGDAALHETHYQSLLAYHQEQTALGRSHPFLTEALADFTEDLATSVRYFKLSLEQARDVPHEPIYTKMISLAERLIQLGQFEMAEAYLRDGRAEAVRCSEPDWIKNADELMKNCRNA
ncbi:MAG: hypothetical protein H0X66_12195 [Verrucomicrobia bacterium]|nr:hypothetical protein [Verrucomicrobiota bacterium]